MLKNIIREAALKAFDMMDRAMRETCPCSPPFTDLERVQGTMLVGVCPQCGIKHYLGEWSEPDVYIETEQPAKTDSRGVAFARDPHVLVVHGRRFNFANDAKTNIAVAKAAIRHALYSGRGGLS